MKHETQNTKNYKFETQRQKAECIVSLQNDIDRTILQHEKNLSLMRESLQQMYRSTISE